MKKEALNEKRLHRGSDKPCTVRGALRAKKKKKKKKKSESKSKNRVSARAKLEVSNVFYAYFILKQKNVKYGVFYYFSAVSFNYDIFPYLDKLRRSRE